MCYTIKNIFMIFWQNYIFVEKHGLIICDYTISNNMETASILTYYIQYVTVTYIIRFSSKKCCKYINI